MERNPRLAEFSIVTENECRAKLQARWSAIQTPVNRSVAEYILSLPLMCLSEYDGDRYDSPGKSYWLTFFANGDEQLSLVTDRHPQRWPDIDFPIDAISGLREFMTFFGGITDWLLPPGSRFCTPDELMVMRSNDKNYSWGMIDGWDGSLVFYLGGTGDQLVVRGDGATGKWQHDIGWENPEEHAIWDLKTGFPELISSYIEYCKRCNTPDGIEGSPFYY